MEFGRLFDQFELNKQELEKNIAQLLITQSDITLRELTTIRPINKGLEEVISYFSIAANSAKHIINSDKLDIIEWQGEDAVKRSVALPEVVFVR